MKGQFIAIYQSNSTTQVTTHSNILRKEPAEVCEVKKCGHQRSKSRHQNLCKICYVWRSGRQFRVGGMRLSFA